MGPSRDKKPRIFQTFQTLWPAARRKHGGHTTIKSCGQMLARAASTAAGDALGFIIDTRPSGSNPVPSPALTLHGDSAPNPSKVEQNDPLLSRNLGRRMPRVEMQTSPLRVRCTHMEQCRNALATQRMASANECGRSISSTGYTYQVK